MRLSSLSSAALAAAVVAAAAVLAFSALPKLFVWAAFIGWASYDHSGATVQAAIRSSAALVFGVLMAWLVAVIVAAHVLPANAVLSTAIVAGAASFLIVIASRTALLSVVPATFYGFASTFAYLSLSSEAFTTRMLTSFGWSNVIVSVPVSLLIGTGLGIVHARLANVIATREAGSGNLGLSGDPRVSKHVR
ncbi:DUF1097 domain-containing protein [Bradyrhizobium sp.]|uniref:DUF1097 domain-containing protein n=1 Tax=Bradyrhizobium sp. TaxID=376 RepID=UPI0026018FFA|nr:DUF1097 domain-containing protein [Bradyrhizobium sp.]